MFLFDLVEFESNRIVLVDNAFEIPIEKKLSLVDAESVGRVRALVFGELNCRSQPDLHLLVFWQSAQIVF